VLAVRWYLRYGLSYRDVEELLAERGIEVDRSCLVHTPRYDLEKCIWERTVNPSAMPSKVRILDLPHQPNRPLTSMNMVRGRFGWCGCVRLASAKSGCLRQIRGKVR
jgi:hypothetical protein